MLTGAVLAAAIAVFALAPDMTTRSQLGDYLSGFANAIAFIWLIAAYMQQGRELGLQRQEIALQRQSLNLQRDELKKMGKYAGLAQVAHLLEQFDQSLKVDPNAPAKSASELPIAFMNGIGLWKTLTESEDPNAVLDAYIKWMKIYAPCVEFVARVASAVDLYCEAAGEVAIFPGAQPADRIFFGFEQIRAIPHISNYAGSAYAIASNMVLIAPGLDRIQLAGLEAAEKIMPGVAKAEALQELRAKVKAHDNARKAAKDKNGT